MKDWVIEQEKKLANAEKVKKKKDMELLDYEPNPNFMPSIEPTIHVEMTSLANLGQYLENSRMNRLPHQNDSMYYFDNMLENRGMISELGKFNANGNNNSRRKEWVWNFSKKKQKKESKIFSEENRWRFR